jgi:hypothetical protein
MLELSPALAASCLPHLLPTPTLLTSCLHSQFTFGWFWTAVWAAPMPRSLGLSSGVPWTVTPRLLCPWNSPGKTTGTGCHSLLQGIFLAQGWHLSLLHCRQILYHLMGYGLCQGHTDIRLLCGRVLLPPIYRRGNWAQRHGVTCPRYLS